MNGATKTKIMYDAYLSDENVQDYLKFLLKEDLLSYDKMSGVKTTLKATSLLRFIQGSNERITPTRLQDDDDIIF